MFNNAQAKFNQKEDLANAYLELKDLYSINPNYPGLANLILELEYELGIKIRPPNAADLRRSRNLYTRALAIYEQGNVQFFPDALDLCDRAIELDPRNSAARELKDLIAIYVTGDTTFVLSPADQLLYQEAEDLVLDELYYQAYPIILKLLENPANRNYSPLLELKRRTELNIQ